MNRNSAETVLNRLAGRIGPGVRNLSFRVRLDDDRIALTSDMFDLQAADSEDAGAVFKGRWRDIEAVWSFRAERGGLRVDLDVRGNVPLGCSGLESLILEYEPGSGPMDRWLIPTSGLEVDNMGMVAVGDLKPAHRSGSKLRGVFPDSVSPGLFTGTVLPQSCLHLYEIDRLSGGALKWTCVTKYPRNLSESSALRSEATWVTATLPLKQAIETHADHVPPLPEAALPPIGWNSWDYYFRAISIDDIIENMDAILRDADLARHVRTIVVDSGWEHVEGEWYANYRFPGGLARLTEEITRRGFVPGIWSDPIRVGNLSTTAMRRSEMLVRNEFGDPQSDNHSMFMVDPTHPLGREYIREIYTRLYHTGFRLFKVDFVECLLRAHRFHDRSKGPYDALRELFSLIRECVTPESHIIGCSLPAECGPATADSGRFGIDIHNHWSHVEWVADFLHTSYWQHGRIWINDPDFLIVRGSDTSLERETNVLNPAANRPNPPRWRSGPVFTLEEARTWTHVVALSGGSVFLSDRIAMLNGKGLELIRSALHPSGVAARPLDLGDAKRASLWLQEMETVRRLTVINWSDRTEIKRISFGSYGIDSPYTVDNERTGESLPLKDGELDICLNAHESIVLLWPIRADRPEG